MCQRFSDDFFGNNETSYDLRLRRWLLISSSTYKITWSYRSSSPCRMLGVGGAGYGQLSALALNCQRQMSFFKKCRQDGIGSGNGSKRRQTSLSVITRGILPCGSATTSPFMSSAIELLPRRISVASFKPGRISHPACCNSSHRNGCKNSLIVLVAI